MRKSLKSVTKIFEMGLIHNRGLKPTNIYITLFNFSIYDPLPPVFGSMCTTQLAISGNSKIWTLNT